METPGWKQGGKVRPTTSRDLVHKLNKYFLFYLLLIITTVSQNIGQIGNKYPMPFQKEAALTLCVEDQLVT
jgi:hypothetical protein